MSIAEIIEIITNRIAKLAEAREFAVRGGDLAGVSDVDAEIAATETTLALLQTLA